MTDDQLEVTVPSNGNDDTSVKNSSIKFCSPKKKITLTNPIFSSNTTNSSSIKTNPIRRTFNICDILAKPSSTVDNNNNNNNNRESHQLNYLIEQQQQQLHSDDEINGSMSDCDASGKNNLLFLS